MRSTAKARKRPVVFTSATAARVTNSTRRVEKTPRGGKSTENSPGDTVIPGVQRATVTTAIPTGTIGSPSTSGVITLYKWNRATGTSAAGRTNVRCCNDMTLSSSVPAGTTVKVCWIAGDYWLLTSDCY